MKYTHEDGTPFSKEEFLEKLRTDKEFNDEFGNKGIDQIANLINDLKTNPDSRRLMVNAWNVGELDSMVLPPCHYGFQVYTRELSQSERTFWIMSNRPDKLGSQNYLDGDRKGMKSTNYDGVPTRAISLIWNQRSVDTALGWPYNVASYGILLLMLSKQVNMVTDELICNLGDCHIYLNHIDGVKEQLMRQPYDLPNLKISDKKVDDISEYTLDDFILENYQSHSKIYFPLSN